MEIFERISATENTALLVIVGLVVVFLWFLPALLAVFFNPTKVKAIFLACIPAGFSLIAWSAVLVWSVTGKVSDKLTARFGKKAKNVAG